jgi:hypothetical protein
VTQGIPLIGEGKFLSGSRDEAETGRDVGSRDPEGHLAGNLHFRTIRSMQFGEGTSAFRRMNSLLSESNENRKWKVEYKKNIHTRDQTPRFNVGSLHKSKSGAGREFCAA